ncbi:MAG: hypothetical protein JST16_07685, partial [Bdellovibrionales bacterium]|nr:hypothetical protein [Bdellovibrionales bacterium]
FHWVHATGSMTVARHLYFGTPYPAYRERLCADFGWSRSDFERGDYPWTLGGRPRANCWLHLASGAHSGRGAALKPTSVLSRSLRALAQDFYGGLTLAALHGEVFPGRHYNPMSSPNVMHQILSRLREWLRRSGLLLEVVEARGFYSLAAPTGVILKVSGQHTVDPHRSALQTRFGQTFFSRQELATELKLSARSAQRYVQELLQAGEVEAHGRARATRYRLTVQS